MDEERRNYQFNLENDGFHQSFFEKYKRYFVGLLSAVIVSGAVVLHKYSGQSEQQVRQDIVKKQEDKEEEKKLAENEIEDFSEKSQIPLLIPAAPQDDSKKFTLKLKVEGEYDKIKLHKFEQNSKGIYLPSKKFVVLKNSNDPSNLELKLDIGIYQPEVFYTINDKSSSYVFPLVMDRDRARTTEVPTFNPNHFKDNKKRNLTFGTWIYIDFDQENENGVPAWTWLLDKYTEADMDRFAFENFLSHMDKSVIAKYEEAWTADDLTGRERSRKLGKSGLDYIVGARLNAFVHMPAHPTKIHRITRKGQEYNLPIPFVSISTDGTHFIPDPQRRPNITRKDMESLSAILIPRVLIENPIDDVDERFKFYNLTRFIKQGVRKQAPGQRVTVGLPTVHMVIHAYNGVVDGNQLLIYGDNSNGPPKEWREYFKTLTEKGVGGMKPLDLGRRSSYGYPLFIEVPSIFTRIVSTDPEKVYRVIGYNQHENPKNKDKGLKVIGQRFPNQRKFIGTIFSIEPSGK